jgi:tRNA pseudouridine38-40 synthase
MTRRLKLTFEFSGAPYHGLQIQPHLPTVQGDLEQAWEKLTGSPVQDFAVAGRTDRGVHAYAMVAHLDTDSRLHLFSIKEGLNSLLRPRIAVREVAEVPPEFHARASAQSRRYRYLILNRREVSPIWQHHAAHVPYPLDLERMRREAKAALGRHDFSSFRTSECQAKTPVTTLLGLELTPLDHDRLAVDVHGTSFLHNMVRILTGTLVDLGRGRLQTSMADILTARDRAAAGKTLPPHGLYFMGVTYPDSLAPRATSNDRRRKE